MPANERIEFGSAVAAIRALLLADLIGTTVHSRIPTTRPATFIRLQRVGGPAEFIEDKALVVVEAWAQSPHTAERLAQSARSICLAAGGRSITAPGGTVNFIRVNEAAGIADLPDPDSKQHRATFTLEMVVRGVSASIPVL